MRSYPNARFALRLLQLFSDEGALSGAMDRHRASMVDRWLIANYSFML